MKVRKARMKKIKIKQKQKLNQKTLMTMSIKNKVLGLNDFDV